jgi:hypothetical protein
MKTVLKMAFGAAIAFLVTPGSSVAEINSLAGPKLAPGQAVEMTSPAATIVSTRHYQAQLALLCVSTTCYGDFPKAGKNRQLNITRISCILFGSAGSTFGYGYIALRVGTNPALLTQNLPGDYSSSPGWHTLNQALDIQVVGNQHILAYLRLATGTPSSANCALFGTLSVLQ